MSKIILNLFDICGTLDYHPLYMSYDDEKLYHSFCVLCTHIHLNLFIFLGESNSLFTDNCPSLGTDWCLGVLGALSHFELFRTLVWIPWTHLTYHICCIHLGYITTGSDCVKLEDLLFVVLNSGHHEIYWDKKSQWIVYFPFWGWAYH